MQAQYIIPIYVLILYNTVTVPEVNVMVPDISVPEGDQNVTICIVLSTGITEQVIVTAVTGPKSGAANPATGKSDYINLGKTLMSCKFVLLM